MNAVMEQYLQSYVNYLQDDWADWLPITEFASNNHTSETMAVSPFFADLGYDPRWQFDLSAFLSNQAEDQQACSVAKALLEIHDHLRTEMHRAQLHYQETADTHRPPLRTIRWGILCGSSLEIGRLDDHQQSWIIDGMAPSRSHARFPLMPSSSNFTARCRYILFFMCPYLSRQHRIRFRDNNNHCLLQWKSTASKNGSWIPFLILECIEDDSTTLSNGPDLITRIGSQQETSTS